MTSLRDLGAFFNGEFYRYVVPGGTQRKRQPGEIVGGDAQSRSLIAITQDALAVADGQSAAIAGGTRDIV